MILIIHVNISSNDSTNTDNSNSIHRAGRPPPQAPGRSATATATRGPARRAMSSSPDRPWTTASEALWAHLCVRDPDPSHGHEGATKTASADLLQTYLRQLTPCTCQHFQALDVHSNPLVAPRSRQTPLHQVRACPVGAAQVRAYDDGA